MNILDLNSQIYGCKDLKQGEYVDFMLQSIEKQEMLNINDEVDYNKITKEIKF